MWKSERVPNFLTPRTHLRLLGGFELAREGRIVPLPAATRRLVALLGLSGRRCRAEVAMVLWPDVPDPRAMGNLRSVLWRLNSCQPGVVLSHNQQLILDHDMTIDSAVFLESARSLLRRPLAGSTPITLTGIPELLPGWYDSWVLDERERIRQVALQAFEQLSTLEMEQGRFGLAIEYALAAVRADPLRESAHRVVIAVHLAQGNRIEAHRHFRSYAALLRGELGVNPTSLMTDMFEESRGRVTTGR